MDRDKMFHSPIIPSIGSNLGAFSADNGIHLLQERRSLLDFVGRGLEDIPEDAVTKPIKTLLLDNNRLSQVPPLPVFRGLEKLSLRDNEFLSTESLLFFRLLRVLDLQENRLQSTQGFQELQHLEWLSLASNQIKGMCNLQQCQALQYLDLSQNRIEGLEDLSALHHLKVLILRDNKIITVKTIPYHLPPSVTQLDLSGNYLEDLSEMLLLHFLPVLEIFSFQGNPCFLVHELPARDQVRAYILCWCKHLRILDDKVVSHIDRQNAKDLALDGQIRAIEPGQHARLMKYLFPDAPSPAPLHSITVRPEVQDMNSPSVLSSRPRSAERARATGSTMLWMDETPAETANGSPDGKQRMGRETYDLELVDVSSSTGEMLLSESMYVPVVEETSEAKAGQNTQSFTNDDLQSLSWTEIFEHDRAFKQTVASQSETEPNRELEKASVPFVGPRVHFSVPTIHLVSPRCSDSLLADRSESDGSILTKPRMARPRRMSGRSTGTLSTKEVYAKRRKVPFTSATVDQVFAETHQSSTEPAIVPARKDMDLRDDLTSETDALSSPISEEEALKLLHLAASLIQAHVKGFLQRTRFRLLRVYHRAAIRIQALWRGHAVRCRKNSQTKAVECHRQGSLEERMAMLESVVKRMISSMEAQDARIARLQRDMEAKMTCQEKLFKQILIERDAEIKRLKEIVGKEMSHDFKPRENQHQLENRPFDNSLPAFGKNQPPLNSSLRAVHGKLVNSIWHGALAAGLDELRHMRGFAHRLSHQIHCDAVSKQGINLQVCFHSLNSLATGLAAVLIRDAVYEAGVCSSRKATGTDGYCFGSPNWPEDRTQLLRTQQSQTDEIDVAPLSPQSSEISRPTINITPPLPRTHGLAPMAGTQDSHATTLPEPFQSLGLTHRQLESCSVETLPLANMSIPSAESSLSGQRLNSEIGLDSGKEKQSIDN